MNENKAQSAFMTQNYRSGLLFINYSTALIIVILLTPRKWKERFL